MIPLDRWFTEHKCWVWPQLQFCIFANIFNCTFSLSGGIKDKVYFSPEFLLQSPPWMARYSTCMLVYSDHLQKRLDFCHVLLIFLIWCHFDLVKQVKFGVSGVFCRTHGRNDLKFDILMNPDHIWNWLHLGHGLLVFLILAPFSPGETCQMCSFQAFSWQCIGGMGRHFSCSSLSCDIPRNEKGKF